MRKTGFISAYRQQVNTLLDTLEELEVLRGEYNALDFETLLVDEDFIVSHDDLTAESFKAAVGTCNTINDMLSGTVHETNLYTVKG